MLAECDDGVSYELDGKSESDCALDTVTPMYRPGYNECTKQVSFYGQQCMRGVSGCSNASLGDDSCDPLVE